MADTSEITQPNRKLHIDDLRIDDPQNNLRQSDDVQMTPRALDESQRQLDAIIRSAMDAIITTDENRRILIFNQAAEKMFGCRAQEALGESLERFIPERFREAHAEHVRHFGVTGETARSMRQLGQIRGVRCNGEEFPLEASISCVERGGRNLFTAILRDIGERERAEASRRWLAAIVESTDSAILSKDLNGVITTWNKGAETLYGYSEAEAVGQNIDLIIPPELREEERDFLRRVAQGKVVRRQETVRMRKDGSRIYMSVSLSPVRDGTEAIIGASTVAHDITESKHAKAALEESEKKLRLFIEHAPAALAMFDREMRYLEASARWKTERGLNGRDIRGELHYEVFPWAKRWKEEHQRALGGEAVKAEDDRLESIDGTVRWIRWEMRPWHAKGEIGGIVIFTEDITARKQAEEKAQEYTRELKRSNEELEHFAYVASHDLQEPLRMVASYTELLAERYRGKLDANADKYIGYAVDGARRMQRLIQDLLAYARVSSQARPLQPTDASAVADAVIATMKGAIEKSQGEVICTRLPAVMADDVQLGQVLQNLIGNALKFRSEKPPHVEIKAEADGEFWRFEVRDNGIGMEKEHSGRIFQMFQRLHTRAEYEGTGIGLAISKRIVERHGGKIWFDSVPGEGTTFYFTLPRAEAGKHDRAFPSAAGRG